MALTTDDKRCFEDYSRPYPRSSGRRTPFVDDVDVEAIWDQMFRTSLALFIVFWVAIYFSYGRDLTFDPSMTCRTKVCRTALAYTTELKSSNTSLACDDFYEYACSLWNAKNPLVSDVFAVLENAADSLMTETWNKSYTYEKKQTIFDKTAMYYFSCIQALRGSVPLERNLESYLGARGIKMRTTVALGRLLLEATSVYDPRNTTTLYWGPSVERGLCKNCKSYLQKALSMAVEGAVTSVTVTSVLDLDALMYSDKVNDRSQETNFTRGDLIEFVNGSEPSLRAALDYLPDVVTVIDASSFKYALNLLFSEEYVNVSYQYLYLKLLREPLRNHRFVASQPVRDKERSTRLLCRRKLESKLLAVWNVLSFQTVSTQSSPELLERAFETVKASLMDRIRISSWLSTDEKDHLMDNLVRLKTATPDKLDYVGNVRNRYRDAPDLGPDFYENDWLLRHYTEFCRFQMDILCGPFQDRHHIAFRNGTMELTAVHRLAPMYYPEADPYINAATLYYHIASRIIVGLLEDIELSNASQAKCFLHQESSAGLQLGTLLALTTGLRLAYDIGKPKVRKADDRVDTVTEDQLFFLRAGLLFCASGDGGENRARCNAAVRNIPEFYLAFWCPSDAPLARSGVCELM